MKKSMPDTARIEMAKALGFILAGEAIFTIRNTRTGNRMTYKVVRKQGEQLWFVRYLSGPDNTSDYAYLGIVTNLAGPAGGVQDLAFRTTAKSCASPDSMAVQCFQWTLNRMVQGLPIPPQVEIWHEGCCGRCGRRLTVPESIASGFGPECIKKAMAA